jgi:hypothetical protein
MNDSRNEIGRSCSMHGGEEGFIWDFDGRVRRKEATKNPFDVSGRVISKQIL